MPRRLTSDSSARSLPIPPPAHTSVSCGDRQTGAAGPLRPRQVRRVPPGAPDRRNSTWLRISNISNVPHHTGETVGPDALHQTGLRGTPDLSDTDQHGHG
jgi:hypothetical protein